MLIKTVGKIRGLYDYHSKKMKKIPCTHIIITGTGRADTTFLVQLLTNLRLDTGFTRENMALFEHARAGLEHDVRYSNAPYIVKDPCFCDYAEDVLKRDDIQIEHVFVPMRDLDAAAESRRYVVRKTPPKTSLTSSLWAWAKLSPAKPPGVAGGLWHTDNADEQENILLQQIYKLTLALSDTTIPLTLLRYPRITKDSSYLYEKLKPILGEIGNSQFSTVFEETIRPDWVHSFTENDC